MPDLPPLRYLTAADVVAAMPPLPERLALAERTLRGLAGGRRAAAEDRVHPRPPRGRSPTRCRPTCPARTRTGPDDLVGMKWIAGYPANNALGLPAIHGAASCSTTR